VKSLNSLLIGIHYYNLVGAWHHLSLWKPIGWHICFYINESVDSFA